MRQGKSTLALFIARQSPTRVIYDPRKQFHTSEVVFTGSEDDTFFNMLDNEQEIIVRPGLDGERWLDFTAQEILDWIEQNPGEKICFLIDEANMVGLDAKPQDSFPHLNYLLRSAGEENVNIVITSHRIIEMHPAIRSIATYVCMFRTTHESDLEAIRQKCGAEVMEIVQKLPPNELVVWDDNFGTWKIYSDRSKWFVELNPQTRIKANE